MRNDARFNSFYCHVLGEHVTVEDDPTYGWQTLIGLASQTRVKTCIH